MKLYSLTFCGEIECGFLFRQPNTKYIFFSDPNKVIRKPFLGFNYDVEFSLHSEPTKTIATLISIELSNTQI